MWKNAKKSGKEFTLPDFFIAYCLCRKKTMHKTMHRYHFLVFFNVIYRIITSSKQKEKSAENVVKSTLPTPFISHRGDKI